DRGDRAGRASGGPRYAHRRAEVHERVMPAIGVASRQQRGVEVSSLALTRDAPEQGAPENAADVRVGERHPRAMREAGDGAGRVRAHTGQRVETTDVARQRTRMETRAAPEVARAAVVPEARPGAEHLAERRPRERAERRI